MPEFIPNWVAIEQSTIWKKQIKPWLDEMELEELRRLGTSMKEGQPISDVEIADWRGFLRGITLVRDMPGKFVEINREEDRQEKEDALIRQQAGRRRDARTYDF